MPIAVLKIYFNFFLRLPNCLQKSCIKMSHAWFLCSYISHESMPSIQGYSSEQDPGATELQHCLHIKWHLCNVSLPLKYLANLFNAKDMHSVCIHIVLRKSLTMDSYNLGSGDSVDFPLHLLNEKPGWLRKAHLIRTKLARIITFNNSLLITMWYLCFKIFQALISCNIRNRLL